jgi:myo-inositol catabolism protein IolC
VTPGYTNSLYLLPFDHRHSYLTELFNFSPPLSARQREAVIETKWVIYDGFRDALAEGEPAAVAGLLVDEEFGAGILLDASERGFVTALPTEKSGSDEFEFEFGEDFVSHIEGFHPTFAKALVRFNPEGDPAMNLRQVQRLKRLSDYCRSSGPKFMFELLLPPTEAQRKHSRDPEFYDRELRPHLLVEAIGILQDEGIEPDIWKVEGLDRREDCGRVVEVVRRDGRDEVGCIVLGRAAPDAKVIHWLETAGSVPGFIGFAVGRSTFLDAMTAYVAGNATRDETSHVIASRYRNWTAVFERSRALT